MKKDEQCLIHTYKNISTKELHIMADKIQFSSTNRINKHATCLSGVFLFRITR